jgi:hypothetical protein
MGRHILKNLNARGAVNNQTKKITRGEMDNNLGLFPLDD